METLGSKGASQEFCTAVCLGVLDVHAEKNVSQIHQLE